jgi:hypothetical protein
MHFHFARDQQTQTKLKQASGDFIALLLTTTGTSLVPCHNETGVWGKFIFNKRLSRSAMFLF